MKNRFPISTRKFCKNSFLPLALTMSFALPPQTFAQVPVKTPPTLKLTEPLPGNLFVELARVINPAVVNISTSQTPRGRTTRDPMLELFEQFYGAPMVPRNNRPRPLALGTGFIIREDGLIVTNAHVVSGADSISVQLTENSDKKYDAKLIGSDERTDIALIKITPEGKLPTVSLGNSKDVQVGEWVAAFGNPFNLGHSMTKGIVSSIGREISEINKIPLLQTDASINPGNSGGPLVNTRGQVIGVNNAINAAAQGIGFAIPIDEVKRLIPELESTGSIRKGYLGLGLDDLDDQTAQQLGLENYSGAVVVQIEPGFPAAKAGLKEYDIILEYNGKKIRGTRELIDMVQDTPIGSKAKMLVLRGNRRINLEVQVTEKKNASVARRTTGPQALPKVSGEKDSHKLGLSIANITPELREQFQIPQQIKRPIIVNVEAGSLAAQAGLRIGDVILVVNDVEVDDSSAALKNLKKGKNVLRMARAGRLFVVTFAGS